MLASFQKPTASDMSQTLHTGGISLTTHGALVGSLAIRVCSLN